MIEYCHQDNAGYFDKHSANQSHLGKASLLTKAFVLAPASGCHWKVAVPDIRKPFSCHRQNGTVITTVTLQISASEIILLMATK